MTNIDEILSAMYYAEKQGTTPKRLNIKSLELDESSITEIQPKQPRNQSGRPAKPIKSIDQDDEAT